jgi:hypothetical protein
MREDIRNAFDALDSKAKARITGLKAQRPIKKSFQQLEDYFRDHQVLALASAQDPSPAVASSASEILAIERSARLLVLTEDSMWEMGVSGRLNGSRAEGVRILLADITDVRTRTDRRALRLGQKDRHLFVDHARGAVIETRVHDLHTDAELQAFPASLLDQISRVRGYEAAGEPSVAAGTSVADELAKLAQLRDAGVLTDEEFIRQKEKLL